ncbi:caspase family protein [Bradyrhizobium australiense]|uniref:Caspase family protein n=1 Tax=Bradyrhizobium australiense TaxID=2721161 RepID=A0A7Y4GVF9_9BRAD|nr:caspase family protein [Bradyrhizobium australiense]NOJ42685.1 caspase family protein [Bradyrhizobium australiense]
MRTVRITALVATSIWLLIQPASAENRIALVIGNGSYEKVPELPNPPRDAADIGRALERLGFKVMQTKNASAHEMRKAIVDFGRAAEGAEMAVVFYAGHGMEVGGENWLIPINAELRSDADIESEAVSLRSISLQVSKARQLGLVILDACRNNPFAAKMKRSLNTRAVARGLAPTEPSDNVLIAYAARDGTTASDGDGRNSPFTAALLRNIETPGLEISFLFRNVRDEVMAATNREQQPFVYGSLSKEAIYLKPLATVETHPARPTAVAKLPILQEVTKEKINSRDNLERNRFSPEDAQRVAAMGAERRCRPLLSGKRKATFKIFISSSWGYGHPKLDSAGELAVMRC